ncbi:FAD NAD-binding domain-containing protein [Mycena sanguinolenta]|uniref:FAD NAD-binding domain-containing protein n=1 Tax=Mycena sanguinolenta TaxID=230812 RepID=A0A8H6Y2P0_9AGAR|nr:FAD NAD-binding domain-containing protein [Mycena sanguinolenta]
MSEREYKFRVAIAGCGIGGLALAAFINSFTQERHGDRIAIDIYEAKPEVSTIGAGVAIWKRSWRVLQDLGFEEEIVKRGFKVPKDGESRGPIFRKSDQPTEGFDFHDHMMPYGPLGLHRPTFLDILRSKLPADCNIHTSKRLEKYTTSGKGSEVHLVFTDGSVATADILVGADGIHSATRASLFALMGEGYQQYIQPTFSGTIAYRGSFPKAKLAEAFPNHRALEHPKLWCGKNMHVVSHPLGPSIGMICYCSEPDVEGKPFYGTLITDVATEDVVKRFANWEPDLRPLIEGVETYNAWAIHVVNPLPCYVSGSVVLIGDAAHAMTPHQGVGGGQAIEDAHILARLLSHPVTRKENITGVLKIFEDLRLAPTQGAAERSRTNGMMYEFNHPDFLFNDPCHPDEPSREELEALGDAVGLSFGWLADGNVEEDWAEAEAKLKNIAESEA